MCVERESGWIIWYALVKGRNVKDMENATTKKGCTVVAYFGGSQSVKLPKKIGSYKITNFGTGFSTLTNIQTITMPSGYTTIESKAFNGLGQLYRISIPASVKSIADDAFAACNLSRLTIVAPYGSEAEHYAFLHGIHPAILSRCRYRLELSRVEPAWMLSRC